MFFVDLRAWCEPVYQSEDADLNITFIILKNIKKTSVRFNMQYKSDKNQTNADAMKVVNTGQPTSNDQKGIRFRR